jgi:predicted transcriptional regulator
MKSKQIAPNYYVNIFDSMMAHFKIQVEHAWILNKLLNLSKSGIDASYISTDILAETMQISQRTVQRHINTLVKKELLQVKRTKWNRTKMKPTKEVMNWIWAQRCENETVKGINDSAEARKEVAA